MCDGGCCGGVGESSGGTGATNAADANAKAAETRAFQTELLDGTLGTGSSQTNNYSTGTSLFGGSPPPSYAMFQPSLNSYGIDPALLRTLLAPGGRLS